MSHKISKRTNKPYIELKIDDLNESGKVLIMNDAYEKYKDKISVDTLVIIEGRTSKEENGEQPSVFVNSIEPLESAREKKTKNVSISLTPRALESSDLDRLIETCERFPGKVPVWIKLKTAESGTFKVKTNRYRVSPAPEAINELRKILGSENVWIG